MLSTSSFDLSIYTMPSNGCCLAWDLLVCWMHPTAAALDSCMVLLSRLRGNAFSNGFSRAVACLDDLPGNSPRSGGRKMGSFCIHARQSMVEKAVVSRKG